MSKGTDCARCTSRPLSPAGLSDRLQNDGASTSPYTSNSATWFVQTFRASRARDGLHKPRIGTG